MLLVSAQRGPARLQPTYKHFLQSGNKQMGHFGHLSEGEAGDWTAALVQIHHFTVTISGDVPFGQQHAAVCEACQEAEQSCQYGRVPNLSSDHQSGSRKTARTNGHEVQVLVYTQAGHFCGFVAWDGREDPGAQRIPPVPLLQVPDLHLQQKVPLVWRQRGPLVLKPLAEEILSVFMCRSLQQQ